MQQMWQGRALRPDVPIQRQDSKTGNVLFADENGSEDDDRLHNESDSEYVFAVDQERATTQIQIGGIQTKVDRQRGMQ
jgi:hypothetical protein